MNKHNNSDNNKFVQTFRMTLFVQKHREEIRKAIMDEYFRKATNGTLPSFFNQATGTWEKNLAFPEDKRATAESVRTYISAFVNGGAPMAKLNLTIDKDGRLVPAGDTIEIDGVRFRITKETKVSEPDTVSETPIAGEIEPTSGFVEEVNSDQTKQGKTKKNKTA